MALGAQLPVRLEESVDKRLQAAAEKAGTTKSALIRMLAKTFTEQCIDDNGQVILPPAWSVLLADRDGRTKPQAVDVESGENVHEDLVKKVQPKK